LGEHRFLPLGISFPPPSPPRHATPRISQHPVRQYRPDQLQRDESNSGGSQSQLGNISFRLGHVTAIMRKLQSSGEGVGAWSINKEILLWSLILKKAKLWSRLRDDYRPLRIKSSDIGRALTRDELRRLADVAESSVDWEAAL